MKEQRPKLKISLSTFDLVLEVTAVIMSLFCIIITLVFWSHLPDRIPTHFNLAGQADSYGSKATVFFILPVMLFLYLVFTILVKFPHTYNYVVKISEKNAERQYRLATRLMRLIKNEIIAICTFIQISILTAVKSGTFNLGMTFVPIIIVIIFGTIGYYIVASIKAR